MSIPIIESSAKAVSLITGGVAAVVLVVSETSIDNFVDKIVDPPSLISTIKVAPVGATLTEHLTAVKVKA